MSLNPLYESTNKTVFSSVFHVPPRQVCILYAYGLAKHKVRVDATEIQVPQQFCVRRLLHDYDGSQQGVHLDCSWIFDINAVKADKIVDQVVKTCDKPWSLTRCRNIGIIGIPGTYRLELNDVTAIGNVNVYAELQDVDAIPSQVKDIFYY